MPFIVPNKSSKAGTTNIWDTLLESVANRTVRASPDKTLLLLGGTVNGTRQFVDLLREHVKTKKGKSSKQVIPTPCSNFGTFTYVDIEDADTEEHLGRIKLYLLPGSEPVHVPALKDFIASQSPEDLVLCLLFDWHAPWTWLNHLQFWLRSLSGLITELQKDSPEFDSKCQDQIREMEIHIRTFTETHFGAVTNAQVDPSLSLPLERGEFDKPLGIPLCCIAQNAEYTQILESDHGWREEQFDYIQQVMRTILLRYGASLIYTTTIADDSLQLPYRYLLREHFASIAPELGNQKSDKAVTVVRDQVFVPTGWDSWGKIKALREGFDTEGISKGWDIDLQEDTEQESAAGHAGQSTVSIYEEVITRPRGLNPTVNTFRQDEVVVPIDPMKILRGIEQRQWEVQEAQQEQNDDYETSPERPTTGHAFSRIEVSDRHAARPVTTASSGTVGRSGANKDEYVQAFFQNLLNRSNSEKVE